MDNITAIPLTWHGHSVDLSQPLNPQVTQPILWELLEVSFRWELLALDRWLYDVRAAPEEPGEPGELPQSGSRPWGPLDASTQADREAAVLSGIPHFGGGLLPDLTISQDVGFAAKESRERAEALAALWDVMAGWNQTPKYLSHTSWVVAEGLRGLLKVENLATEDFDRQLDNAEYHIIYWYIQCFVEVFGRPPQLPHRRFA